MKRAPAIILIWLFCWGTLFAGGVSNPGGGSVATDPIFTAKGDLAVGTGASASGKLAVGPDRTTPIADSSQTNGIRWGDSVTTVDIRDEFLSGSSTTGSIGALGWLKSGTAGSDNMVVGIANHPGIYETSSGATASALYHCMNLGAASATGSIMGTDLFDVTFILKAGQAADANSTMRVGVSNSPTVAGRARTDDAFFENVLGEANWFIRNKGSNVASSRTDTTVAVSSSAWVKMRIRRIDASTIGFTINAGTEQTIATNTPQIAVQPFVQTFNNNTAAAKFIDVDYFRLVMPVTR